MLLTITTTHKPATDMGYLFHKSPFRCQAADMSFGTANIFYPEANEDKCTLAILIDVDSVGLVRCGRARSSMSMDQYVSDRPYVCSSFLSVAISRLFGDALKGKCKKRPELVELKMPLVCRITSLPCRAGEDLLKKLFEPLGYSMKIENAMLDEKFPDWGESPYFNIELSQVTTVAELMTHLYVLIPVLDNRKHYYVDEGEIDKLVQHGGAWLSAHPEKELIARRYLKYKTSYTREALERLDEENPIEPEDPSIEPVPDDDVETAMNLNDERLGTVLSVLKSVNAATVMDLGCGEGKLLRMLLKEKQFTKILGMDVSTVSLEMAAGRMHYDDMPSRQRERIQIIHGSLMYRDKRFEGFEAASIIEVIEHFDAPRLKAFERVVFEAARPGTVVITTPNREYNTVWENIPPGGFRHRDHRFEWTRAEFVQWAESVCSRFSYAVRFLNIGTEVPELGTPTQMAVFTRGA
ncbi:MAG: 3' terminal RNA ribose 2'-O-methyltransferase Hen1 [Victivallales bacterium]